MSEYIYWQDDSGLYKREEIVRCRDCKYHDLQTVVYSSKPLSVCMAEWCEGSEHELVEPNGYCKWGERREGC